MAETFLSPVIEKLIDLLIEEGKSLKEVHKQVESLQKELEIIEPLLRDAEAKSARGHISDAAKVWLRQLREEAERIEDVVDEYACLVEQRHRRYQAGFVGSLAKAGRHVKALKTRRDLASEIRDVKESLSGIKERGLSYGLRPFEQGGEGNSRVDPRIGSLFVDDDQLVGIESMSKELVRSLVDGPSERVVVSLVGEGGIGKTTLARKVYNDVVGKGGFDHEVWVTVSQSYDIDKILKILMDKICQIRREVIEIEEAFVLLRSSLEAKRYVIVFDDVWQTDFWSVIRHALPSNNSRGSRVLVTTRKSTVVDSFRQNSCDMIIHELQPWSTEQAWKLFCKKTFACSESESCCPPELERLSHEILSKCQGLPLAIVAVAGLLSKKDKSKVEWQKVVDNLNNEFEENSELSSVSKVLLFSYHDLPYHLKLCFLYFGILPEDSLIQEGRLCKIWIAEGFVKLKKDKTLEQIADEYLTELISRKLVSLQIWFGYERHCKVHDLMRELIQTRASDLGFYQIFSRNKQSCKEKGRRLIIYDTTENVLKGVGDSKIRSVALFNTYEVTNTFVVGLFKRCKLLKVVEFNYAPLYNLPTEVGNLLHLKYLNLGGTKLKTLPKSIGKLHNLQTLNLRHTFVRELPVEINKLHKLRHLIANNYIQEREYNVDTYAGVKMHEGFGRLEELQTLIRVEASAGRVDFIKELQNLRKLRSLALSKVAAEMSEALGESVEKMNDLQKLYLSSINQYEVLDLTCILSPPLHLSYVSLSCRLQQFPSWVSELHNLHGLELKFSRLVKEPLKCLKGLPNLAYIYMYQTYDGEELHFEERGFPKLKQLELRKLKGLKMLKIERGALPLLEKLAIGPYPLMTELPCDIQHLTNLKSLTIADMPREFVTALQPGGSSEHNKIKHIPYVAFSYYKGSGDSYDSYKLGSSELLKRLEEQQ